MPAGTIRSYVLIVLLVTFVLQAAIAAGGGPDSPVFNILAPLVMFVPSLAALFELRRSGLGWRAIQWGPGRLRYLLLAPLLPSGIMVVFVVALEFSGVGLSPGLRLSSSSASIEAGLWLLGEGVQPLYRFVPNLVLSSLVVGMISGLLAVGEEVGWRGYLQAKLLSRFGSIPGIAILGLVWAAWHMPLILQGYNFPSNPILGALLLFPLMGICWSYILAWLTIRGESVWPAVLAHGSMNGVLGSVLPAVEPAGSPLLVNVLLIAVLIVAALPAALALPYEVNVPME